MTVLKNINELEKEEDVWKITPGKKEDNADVNKESLKEISLVSIYHCIEANLDEWIPDLKDKETFWDVMCFYCDFTYRIYSTDYPYLEGDAGYRAIPNNILRNAAYAIYKDFDGNLPTIDNEIWRAYYYNEEATGITVGDNAPIIITSENYQKNEDGTIDAEYVTEYSGSMPAGTYKVHFEPNTHYNEVDADATFYYRVSRVERTDTATAAKDNKSEKARNNNDDSWRQSYVDFIENDSEISTLSEWCTCGLIYLDDDDIPELIIDYGIEASGTRIVSYKNGDTTSFLFARTGGIHYIERGGLVYNAIGHQGVMNDELASLDNEGFHDLGRGVRYDEDQDYSNYIVFNWNNEEVSEEVYYSNINSVFDYDKSVRWDSYSDDIPGVTYRMAPDEMCEYLISNSVSQRETSDEYSIDQGDDSVKYTMDEFGIPYGHYSGGKSQGDGIFGLDMDLYEGMTFSINSAFDLFSDENGDEYSFTGTYHIDRVNNDGNPVLILHSDEGDYELIWDGEKLFNNSMFAWYEE